MKKFNTYEDLQEAFRSAIGDKRLIPLSDSYTYARFSMYEETDSGFLSEVDFSIIDKPLQKGKVFVNYQGEVGFDFIDPTMRDVLKFFAHCNNSHHVYLERIDTTTQGEIKILAGS